MTITSGFFNSMNHDRLYDAEQLSSIFDGIINDGVFESIGNAFAVSPNSELNDSIIVGIGRAWFDHVWILNDAQYNVTLSPPSTIYKRIDAVVLDVDRRDSVRAATISVVEGTPALDPVPPSMLDEELHKQYPVAYITMPPGESEIISGANIKRTVGTDDCPIVTGPLEVVNSDTFFAQMDAAFNEFQTATETEWDQWFETAKDAIADVISGKINLSNTVDDVTIEWFNSKIRVKDRGITRDKLSSDILSAIGILDTGDWDYNDYYSHLTSLGSAIEQEAFLSNVGLFDPAELLPTWTGTQIRSFFDAILSADGKDILFDDMPWNSLDMSDFRYFVESYGSSKYSSMIGKTISLDLGDTLGVHDFRVIGVNHDDLASGGKALLTFQSVDIIEEHTFSSFSTTDTTHHSESVSSLGKYFEQDLYNMFDSDTKSLIKSVNKHEYYSDSLEGYDHQKGYRIVPRKVWMANAREVGIDTRNMPIGWNIQELPNTRYDYYSEISDAGVYAEPLLVKKYLGSASDWPIDPGHAVSRDSQAYLEYVKIDSTGKIDRKLAGSMYQFNNYTLRNGQQVSNFPIVPCFCV